MVLDEHPIDRVAVSDVVLVQQSPLIVAFVTGDGLFVKEEGKPVMLLSKTLLPASAAMNSQEESLQKWHAKPTGLTSFPAGKEGPWLVWQQSSKIYFAQHRPSKGWSSPNVVAVQSSPEDASPIQVIALDEQHTLLVERSEGVFRLFGGIAKPKGGPVSTMMGPDVSGRINLFRHKQQMALVYAQESKEKKLVGADSSKTHPSGKAQKSEVYVRFWKDKEFLPAFKVGGQERLAHKGYELVFSPDEQSALLAWSTGTPQKPTLAYARYTAAGTWLPPVETSVPLRDIVWPTLSVQMRLDNDGQGLFFWQADCSNTAKAPCFSDLYSAPLSEQGILGKPRLLASNVWWYDSVRMGEDTVVTWWQKDPSGKVSQLKTAVWKNKTWQPVQQVGVDEGQAGPAGQQLIKPEVPGQPLLLTWVSSKGQAHVSVWHQGAFVTENLTKNLAGAVYSQLNIVRTPQQGFRVLWLQHDPKASTPYTGKLFTQSWQGEKFLPRKELVSTTIQFDDIEGGPFAVVRAHNEKHYVFWVPDHVDTNRKSIHYTICDAASCGAPQQLQAESPGGVHNLAVRQQLGRVILTWSQRVDEKSSRTMAAFFVTDSLEVIENPVPLSRE